MNPRRYVVCEECYDVRVVRTAWVNVNTHAVVNTTPPRDDVWCLVCDREVATLSFTEDDVDLSRGVVRIDDPTGQGTIAFTMPHGTRQLFRRRRHASPSQDLLQGGGSLPHSVETASSISGLVKITHLGVLAHGEHVGAYYLDATWTPEVSRVFLTLDGDFRTILRVHSIVGATTITDVTNLRRWVSAWGRTGMPSLRVIRARTADLNFRLEIVDEPTDMEAKSQWIFGV